MNSDNSWLLSLSRIRVKDPLQLRHTMSELLPEVKLYVFYLVFYIVKPLFQSSEKFLTFFD